LKKRGRRQKWHIQTGKPNKKSRRKLAKQRRRSGFFRYYFAVIKTAQAKGKQNIDLPKYQVYDGRYSYQSKQQVTFSDNIQYLATIPEAFDKSAMILPSGGRFMVPNPFSLTNNFKESFLFLKRLFFALYADRFEKVFLDFNDCEQIDTDALLCMDILLSEFIEYYGKCWRRKIKTRLREIDPINYQKESIGKVLFSTRTLANIGRKEVKHEGIIPFHLIRGDNFASTAAQEREREVTRMVDYIVESCNAMNRPLTWQAENRLSKVIGEVLVNAAEHSGRKYRYAIGYFEKKKNGETDLGVFNFAILSFGKTIYQNFKGIESEGWHVISRMKELSAKYTSNSWFKEKQFEEETLWTLYALQEGVTSIPDKKRGNGSINFIESFFSLKGDMESDHLSFLTLMSGNTRITFEGKYKIVERQRGSGEKPFKMMTFNDSGNIEDKPDQEYVTFADNFFPGTLITAKICINFNNIETGSGHA
jgi:hypothetical protein